VLPTCSVSTFMADGDPFTPLPRKGTARSTPPAAPKATWTTIIPVPANAPKPPTEIRRDGKTLKASRIETYFASDGRLLGHVCRFDLGGGAKEFRPLTYCRGGAGELAWRWQSWPSPRPLFGLDRLAKRAKAPVVVCEGEKAAEAAEKLLPDHVAVTSANGSLAAAKADWTPLAKRHVVIWPDADEPGAKYAAQVVKVLAPIAASVMVVTPPSGVMPGWDAADALAEGWDEPRTRALIAGAVDAFAPKAKRPRGRPRRDGAAPETAEKTPRPRQEDGLLAILEGVELWHSDDKVPYATIPVDGHFENHEVRSRSFRLWFGHEFFKKTKAAASKQAMEEALGHAEALAIFEGKQHVPYIRHGNLDGHLYLDLADDRWRAIRITAKGWQIIDQPPVKFTRSSHMLPLPDPVRPKRSEISLGVQLASEIGDIIPVATEGDLTLIVSWLLMTFHPKGPFPGLGFNGPDGSGKTSAGRVVKRILDPDMAPDRSPPRDELSLIAAARNSFIVAIDNVSDLPWWLSDAMCRLATGGGISTRALYTDWDEASCFLKRPQITTGIPKLADRADFAARWIQITMPRIAEQHRLSEEQFEAKVAARLPRILGMLLTVVSGILANPDEKPDHLPRMADFAVWIARARSALGWHPSKFSDAYEENRGSTGDAVIQSDVIAQAILDLFELPRDEKDEHWTGGSWDPEQKRWVGGTWTGTSTELLAALPVAEAVRKQKGFPAPNRLAEKLTRLQNTLAGEGIEIAFARAANPGRKRIIVLTRREASSAS